MTPEVFRLATNVEDRSRSKSHIPNPPGFSFKSRKAIADLNKDSKAQTITNTARDPAHLALLDKQAYSICLAPLKSIPTNMFMMWMAGNSLQIFSIAITCMVLMTAINGLRATSSTFEQLKEQGVDTRRPRIAYVCAHICGLALAIYKCSAMGVLPNSWADLEWYYIDPNVAITRAGYVL